MKPSMPKFDDDYFLKEIQNASAFVDDILYGRKTIGEVTKIPREDVEETFIKARNALKLEDYKKAAEMFQAVLVINNRDMRALMGLAGALEGLKEYAVAVMAYMVVMMANFKDPVAPYRAGVCLMRLGKKQEASRMFQLAAECDGAALSAEKKKYMAKAQNMLGAVS